MFLGKSAFSSFEDTAGKGFFSFFHFSFWNSWVLRGLIRIVWYSQTNE